MATVQFDSLKYARRLRDVGVPEPQADTQAELMAEAFGFYVDNLVTKEHIDLALDKQVSQIDARFAEQDARIDARFAEQDVRINALSANVAQRFAEQDARIDARFARQERTLAVHTWMLGAIIVTVLLPTLKDLAL